MYIEDFRRMLHALGASDFRTVTRRRLTIDNPDLEDKVGEVGFYSMTIRAFQLEGLEDRCEDHGQVATYLGTIPHHPHAFILDDHHVFEAERPLLVCGNTAAMVQDTRYGRHFRVDGDRRRHFGLFDCGSAASTEGPDACC